MGEGLITILNKAVYWNRLLLVEEYVDENRRKISHTELDRALKICNIPCFASYSKEKKIRLLLDHLRYLSAYDIRELIKDLE